MSWWAAGAEGVEARGWGWRGTGAARCGKQPGRQGGGGLVGNGGDEACTMGWLGAARNSSTATATATATAIVTAASTVAATATATGTTTATATAAASATGTALMMCPKIPDSKKNDKNFR